MKEIYFSHIPWNIHPVYQEMLNHPPEGIVYINKEDFWDNYQKNIHLTEKNKILQKIETFLKKIYILPNISFQKLPGDLVFSASKICLRNPYILDLEVYEALNRFSNKRSKNIINKWIVKSLLKRKNCKNIVFWSDNAKKGFQSYFWNIFDAKIEVVYPALSLSHDRNEILKCKEKSKLRFLFVGRYFERKGGLIALKVFEILSKRYENIYFDIISPVNPEIIDRYVNQRNISFLWLMPRQKVLEYFKKSDFYFMPTFQDTFGMVFLEAFAYGSIPISLNTFAVDNIIDDGIDGISIEYKNKFHTPNFQYIDVYNFDIDSLLQKIEKEEASQIISTIVSRLESLIENESLRQKFVSQWFEKVRGWKFSMDVKNVMLSRLYFQ